MDEQFYIDSFDEKLMYVEKYNKKYKGITKKRKVELLKQTFSDKGHIACFIAIIVLSAIEGNLNYFIISSLIFIITQIIIFFTITMKMDVYQLYKKTENDLNNYFCKMSSINNRNEKINFYKENRKELNKLIECAIFLPLF